MGGRGLVKGTPKWDRALAQQRLKRATAALAKHRAEKAAAEKKFWRRAKPLVAEATANAQAAAERETRKAGRYWVDKCRAEAARKRSDTAVAELLAERDQLKKEKAAAARAAREAAEAERDRAQKELAEWKLWWGWITAKVSSLASRINTNTFAESLSLAV